MQQFILLLHESPSTFEEVSPEDMQRIIEEYGAWRAKLEREGRLSGSHKLADEGGKSLSMRRERLQVVDGPYAEAKEVIGGYFLIESESYEEAVAIAQDCPHLKYGGRIELRRIDPVHG